MTAAYVFVDAERQTLRYAAAGHPPLLVGPVGDDGRVAFREVESNGLLLGIAPEATYSFVEFPFHPGDRCFLYTDGILEAKNGAQEEFGLARLGRFLEQQSHLGSDSLIEASLVELARWSGKGAGGMREDDITLVAIGFRSA